MRKHNYSYIIEYLRRDCDSYGRGRKKWWAQQLDVSNMTLSHWLVGRRQPNAFHMEQIYSIYESVAGNREKKDLADSLWQAYYNEQPIAPIWLWTTAEQLMRADGLSTRLLALISWFLEKFPPTSFNEPPLIPIKRNRLGWLCESAGLEPGFDPAPIKTVTLLEMAVGLNKDNKDLKHYLRNQQTELGKKWRLYDCQLDDLKEKLQWRQPA
ncbi:MAG TPA: hypothetical protein ENH19_03430 [Actinobacteria bacterium]|nr:hypothetical protein [Actinomycetes bacterium]HEX21686.1 hypothetical protein [Actinomycetota bacterium]